MCMSSFKCQPQNKCFSFKCYKKIITRTKQKILRMYVASGCSACFCTILCVCFCHGNLKVNNFTLFTTFLVLTSPEFILNTSSSNCLKKEKTHWRALVCRRYQFILDLYNSYLLDRWVHARSISMFQCKLESFGMINCNPDDKSNSLLIQGMRYCLQYERFPLPGLTVDRNLKKPIILRSMDYAIIDMVMLWYLSSLMKWSCRTNC